MNGRRDEVLGLPADRFDELLERTALRLGIDAIPAHALLGAVLGEVEAERESASGAPLYDLATIRFGRFLAAEPPPRRMLVPDFLPLGIVGLWSGAGGVAKSFALYQLAISVATGAPFLGLPISEPGSVLYLAAEDDEEELHRRGWRLVEHYARLGHSLDLQALDQRLHVVSRSGEDSKLTRSEMDGGVNRTALVGRVVALAQRIPDLKLIIVDPVSRFRGGRANDEEHATAFVEALEHIRGATGATLLASVHVNKQSIRDPGDADQAAVRGSSALVDAARWVAQLQRLPRGDAGKYSIDPSDARMYVRLDLTKTNYTSPWDGMWLRREQYGALVPEHLEETRAAQKVQRVEADYIDVLARIQGALRERGPMSTRRLRDLSGTAGVLGAGDHKVRAVIERALRDGSLRTKAGEITLPPEAR